MKQSDIQAAIEDAHASYYALMDELRRLFGNGANYRLYDKTRFQWSEEAGRRFDDFVSVSDRMCEILERQSGSR